MKFKILLFILISSQSFAQTFKEAELKTSIKNVTVFLQGAQIARAGKSDIQPGKSTLTVKSLSPHIDDKTIQVKANGEFTILSVNHKFNYLDELQKDEKIDSMKNEIESLDLEISKSEYRLGILAEKQSLLHANKDLGGENSGASLTQLKQAIEFYDRELSSIKSEELEIKDLIKELREEKSRIEKQISEVSDQNDLPTGEIEIRVESDTKTAGNFSITYLVANAGWYPKYDVRVKNVKSPIELTYKADVYQRTGVDWNNVQLKFSNGDPNKSGVAPELNTWYLNFARHTIYNRSTYGIVSNSIRSVSGKILDETGKPLPGATVLVKGTTIGTITNIEGDYALTLPNSATHLIISFVGFATQEIPITNPRINLKMEPDIQALEEVVAVGYGLQGKAAGVHVRGASSLKADNIITTTVENQTTVEFEVEKPFSIKSNDEKLSIDLNKYQIEAAFEYHAVPKIDKDAFLITRITNWNQYNLLEGEANLYFEDAYVGRSILNAKTLTDTLDISIGRDKGIVLDRIRIIEFTKKKTIGSNLVESIGYKIIAKNNKSQPVKLSLSDQIPVSALSEITVDPNELSNGKLNEKTGEVTWEMELAPQQQTELIMQYEVKYPKNEKVILE